ncbi:MAG: winged helix-turn-helix domain-containing protein [Pseudomonadota bacterium]|nr:winged helix-turn-helix domain-containing protein [Pseudomonadota bacterium]
MNSGETTLPEPPVDYEFGEFRLASTERRLYRRDGGIVELSPRLFDALLYFVQRPGVLLDKNTLLETLWPGLVVEDNNLNQLVLALRRALADDAQGSRCIQTVPRRGFRFVGAVSMKPVRTATAEAVPPLLPPKPLSPAGLPVVSDPPRAADWSLGGRGAFLLGLLAVLGIAALLLVRSVDPPTPTLTTLAVLPFKPLTLEGRDEVLEVGMADSLIARMSLAPGLVVTSVGSVRRYGGTEQDPLRAARELGVQWILDGTIQRWGKQVRVTARLLRTADGVASWSGSFDDRFEDVFAVQANISERVAQQLAPRLSPGERKRLVSPGSQDLAAYELYLTARFHAQGLSVDGLAKSVKLFLRAIELDPRYALAYAGLADTYRRMAIGLDTPPAEALGLGLKAAERAVEIDPALAEAHAALGWMRWWAEWDWAGAEKSFRRAISINPNLAEAQLGLGHLLCSQQRCGEGFSYVQRSRELDPLSPINSVIEASYLQQRGLPQESRARLDQVFQIGPRFWPAYQLLAGLSVSAGRSQEALEALRKAESLAAGSLQPTMNVGVLLARSGEPQKAREVLTKMLVLSEQRYVPPTMIASLYCALGENERALGWLDRAREMRDVNLPFLGICSVTLKDEPRFDALRRSLKLPAWRAGFCAPLQAPAVACSN